VAPIRQDGLRYGAVAAGALALGAAATAGADKLIDGGDIEDGSIEKRDLSAKAQNSSARSLLFSTVNVEWLSTAFVAPGSDLPFFLEEEAAARVAPGSYRARGLAVMADIGKAEIPVGGVKVHLRIDGANTGLKCTTNANGKCSDSGKVAFASRDQIALRIFNDSDPTDKFPALTRVSLAIQPG